MPAASRILIVGLSSPWGGALAQVLERDAEIDAIVGVDTLDPRHELQRTEFVRVDVEQARLRRIINAAGIDAVVAMRPDQAQEIVAACTEPTVRKLVFASSALYYGCDADDPAFFTEELTRTRPPGSARERELLDAERRIDEFATRNPDRAVTVLRFADAVGTAVREPLQSLLSLPVIPTILGFDPRCQVIHEDDAVGVLAHATRNELPGIYNAAADGVLALSEAASLLGKPALPVLPPWGTIAAAVQLRRLGFRIPVELLRQLRFGRGMDNRRLKATGYQYRYTTREAIVKLRVHQRLRPLLRSGDQGYRYEREVEEFLRWSPSVQSAPNRSGDHGGDGAERPAYDDLNPDELIELISSLDIDALRRLRSYELSHRARTTVLEALDRNLARMNAE